MSIYRGLISAQVDRILELKYALIYILILIYADWFKYVIVGLYFILQKYLSRNGDIVKAGFRKVYQSLPIFVI